MHFRVTRSAARNLPQMTSRLISKLDRVYKQHLSVLAKFNSHFFLFCFTFLQRRPISSLSTLEWLFLGIALLSTLGALGLTLERIIDVPKNGVDAVFAVLLLINIGMPKVEHNLLKRKTKFSCTS